MGRCKSWSCCLNSDNLNGDFFDMKGNSFILVSEAYLDAKWGNTTVLLGRQTVETPHANSDDNRMMPNYFEAYTISNTDIQDVILNAGFITEMAGAGNVIDTSKFVKMGETLGIQNEEIDGLYYLI